MVEHPRRLLLEDYIGIVINLGFLYVAYIGGGIEALIYLTAAAFMGPGFHICSMHFIAEHYLIMDNNSYTNDPMDPNVYDTFSYYGIINKVMFNGGYHVEHHDFPSISWRNLPKLRAMCPEFYENLPSHNSYFAVLIRFIFNHPGIYQRVKRRD